MQRPGKSGRTRGLTNMAATVPAFVYTRPVGAELVRDDSMQLTEEHRFYVKEWMYKGKIVDFAIMHDANVQGTTASAPSHIVRYDCCHSEVHKHQFFRRKSKDEQRTVIEKIADQATAWEVVDANFDRCYDQAIDNCDEHLRRWRE